MIYNNLLYTGCGFATGLMLGSIDNILKTKSLFKYKDTSYRPRFIFSIFESLEQKAEQGFQESSLSRPSFSLWNQFLPAGQITCLLITVIWHTVMIAEKSSDALLNGGISCFKVILGPLLHQFFLMFTAGTYSKTFKNKLKSLGIDTAGHCIAQSSSAAYKIYCLVALQQQGISTTIPKIVMGISSFNDLLWTYNTTANHHSVMDMVGGVSFVALAALTIYGAETLVIKGITFAASQII